ncbi:hypothetical protein NGRA_2259 [Nosema granulosis]|uniref:Uncharacterized protein n=1 Tax=Nosema granulosis TaxID=83296 RepID=A0A9P6KXW3_9MICR|nr:hypothetical protein NGRA_2259 [Nosema granulosis]
MISHLSERSLIYADKIKKWERRKSFRRENTKFELYRGRFYRDIDEEATPDHNVPTEKIKDTWEKMWEIEETEVDEKLFEEYLLEYIPGDLEPTCCPTEEEFGDIVKWLPCWKAAGQGQAEFITFLSRELDHSKATCTILLKKSVSMERLKKTGSTKESHI